MNTCKCGKTIEESAEGKFVAFDLQKGYEKLNFCSADCLMAWVKRKQFTMWAMLVLGALITLSFLISEGVVEGSAAICLLFVPYMIRQAAHGLKDVWNSGAVGECFSFIVVMLGALTVVYPLYKFIQELRQYKELSNTFAAR